MALSAAEVATIVAAASSNKDATKPPMFTESNPDRWFTTFESYTRTRSITSADRQFDLLWSRLTEEQMDIGGAELDGVEDEDRYSTVKNSLLNRFRLTDKQRFERLVNMPALGSSLPSHQLMLMRSIAGTQRTNPYFRFLYLRTIPQNIVNLYDREKTTLDEFAKLADDLVRANPPNSAGQVAAARSSLPADLCFFHAKFGAKARNCKKGDCRLRNEPLAPPNSGNGPTSR